MLTIIYSYTSITKHWKQKLMPEISEMIQVKHLKQILATCLDESWTLQNFQILGLIKIFQNRLLNSSRKIATSIPVETHFQIYFLDIEHVYSFTEGFI